MKSTDDSFRDWESEAFGFGYGSGEEHVMQGLVDFMAALPEKGSYDYAVLEQSLSPMVAWLYINALCRMDIIEYGSSPRFGWLTPHGRLLREYVVSKGVAGLCEVLGASYDEHCGLTYCNCDGGDMDRRCPNNQFWGYK